MYSNVKLELVGNVIFFASIYNITSSKECNKL